MTEAQTTRIQIFLQTYIFFPPFLKKYVSTHSLLESLSPVHAKTLNNENTIASLTEHT